MIGNVPINISNNKPSTTIDILEESTNKPPNITSEEEARKHLVKLERESKI